VKELDIHRLTEQGYAEIDHILPYSRSFDDSQNNKVLVLSEENQQKGNRTPYEYLNGEADSERWRQMQGWLLGTKSIRKAKRDRLLRKSFTGEDAEGFKERNLNDTRYATRLISNHIRQHLRFAPGADGVVTKQPVLNPAGGFTSFLRARWGLIKNREASDLHHALDACVIAAATPSLQKRISDFHRRDELVQLSDGTFADRATGEILSRDAAKALGEHFPQPWANFRDEVQLRLHPEPSLGFNEYFTNYNEAARAAVRPVLVSRAVKRLAGGAVHEDTIRSVKAHLGEATSSKRTPLANLKLATLGDIVGAHDPRNAGLMYVLRLRLEEAGGDGKKAFGPNTPPVYKPRKDLTDGPMIRAVQVKTTQKGGVPVRGGVADQASMWRVDVFEKAGKFYLVPIYQSDRRKGRALPNRASTANTPREQWTLVDESFGFRFSLYANDYVTLATKKLTTAGYFAGLNVATAAINICSHDRNENIGKAGVTESLGVKTGVLTFEKFNVDIVGSRYAAKREKRGDLA
jgi:CRISPR-associated endonuclease Csn1